MMYIIVISSVFLAACAQMLLKQGAHQQYATWWRQYVNGWVISGYAIMFGTMIMNIYAMSKGVQIKELSIIESMSYLFVPALSFFIFKEKLTWRKIFAIAIIITGVIVFFL
ncbi:MAG: EamA family transporter [Paludibacteraceae bacterium]|nr:EamA family transporter [Paludibacteraceae bacterium]